MKVNVCGVPFTVKEVCSIDRCDGSMGRSDAKLGLITINKDMPKEIKDTVLIHEWLHAILDMSGFCDISGNEEVICFLQNELYRNGFRVKVIEEESKYEG